MSRIVYLDDVTHEIKKQYSAHNELIPMWLDLAHIPKAEQTNTAEVTNDDIETMRILFSADINEYCNQGRWNEAKEYEQIRDRLMTALKKQTNTAEWITYPYNEVKCSNCDYDLWGNLISAKDEFKYCPNCGAEMKGENQ